MRRDRFRVRFADGRTPNPQGPTTAIRRSMSVSTGSRSRQIELVVTTAAIGPAGIPTVAMKDPAFWLHLLDAVEATLDHDYDAIDELPAQLTDPVDLGALLGDGETITAVAEG